MPLKTSNKRDQSLRKRGGIKKIGKMKKKLSHRKLQRRQIDSYRRRNKNRSKRYRNHSQQTRISDRLSSQEINLNLMHQHIQMNLSHQPMPQINDQLIKIKTPLMILSQLQSILMMITVLRNVRHVAVSSMKTLLRSMSKSAKMSL